MRVKLLLMGLMVVANLVAKPKPMRQLIDESMKIVEIQCKAMSKTLENKIDSLPRSMNSQGKLILTNTKSWTSGFFPGVLWYLYEYSHKPEVMKFAEMYTNRLEIEKYTTDNHDIGFILCCSYGNGYKQTQNPEYANILTTGAKSLSTRFNPNVGLIRSWDFNKTKWQYPVIIDNMMNLELLLFATRLSGDSSFYRKAVSHADKTMKYHFRPDFSSYHLVSYDTITGLPHLRGTHQGFSDKSSWARGQGWALYGYTVMYEQTRKQEYLQEAQNIAAYIMQQPNLPKDKIPYWDFDCPKIPNSYRDASASALYASALIQLSKYVDKSLKKQYLRFAETEIRTLSSSEYLAQIGTNANFILKHSVGNYPENSEIDKPISYADYYYVEALVRYSKLLK